MLNKIKNVRNLGVFKNYTPSEDLENFKELNIIYGWNYSGKTSISRIFSSIENGHKHSDYSDLSFTIKSTNGDITEHNLSDRLEIVRVFNADFVDNNIEWNGGDFNPILLLGQDSIETQRSIEHYESKLTSFNSLKSTKLREDEKLEDEKSKLHKDEANKIKIILNLIEAFTATHLKAIKPTLLPDPRIHILNHENLNKHIVIGTMSENDKKEYIEKFETETITEEDINKINNLLGKSPLLTQTIDHLTRNPEIANWIDTGLSLHKQSENCEFCGNKISPERITELKGHFSKDLEIFKGNLTEVIAKLDSLQVENTLFSKSDFYSELQSDLSSSLEKFRQARNSYINMIKQIRNAVSIKLSAPFNISLSVQLDSKVLTNLKKYTNEINIIIQKNNEITSQFEERKSESIKKVKNHFAAVFFTSERLLKIEKIQSILKKHAISIHSVISAIIGIIANLQASISQAQSGRLEINKLIFDLLGSEEIRIEVIQKSGLERFSLMRRDSLALNLSEGEKTAIGFAFFLTKLREEDDLKKVVVYIDDPISSLDSNHIFQINAIIKSTFFSRNGDATPVESLKCAQLFLSTHNYEFLSLLKELPLRKSTRRSYFLIRRFGPTESTLENLPLSIKSYASEYHYLFEILHKFHSADDKSDFETLIQVPNAIRRFIELYTYTKIPSQETHTVDNRLDILIGAEKSKRILKVLHYFSHLNNIERIRNTPNQVSDIAGAVSDVFDIVSMDTMHYDALLESLG